MKTSRILPILFTALVAMASAAFAQSTVTTDPVGFLNVTCPAGSDTYISIPLTLPPEFAGSVASVSGSTITLSGTPNLTPSQFVYVSGSQPKTYYMLIGPNPVSLVGTLTTTASSNTITGLGTAFQTGTPAVQVGDTLLVNNSSCYRVKTVDSDTSLTVTIAPTSTASGLSASVSSGTGNPKEGQYYQIVANDASSLTVTLPLAGDDLSTLQAGTQVTVIPYWTLGTLLPASLSGTSFIAATKVTKPQTEILFPDYNAVGTNKSAAFFYFFYNGHWRCEQDSVTTDIYDDTIIKPGGYIILRNPASASTTLTVQGNVPTKNNTIPLYTETNVKQDNYVSIVRPVDTVISQLGLIESGAFQVTTKKTKPVDELLVYLSGTGSIGKNRSADYFYFYYNNSWYREDDGLSHNNDIIPAGSALIIRTGTTSTGNTVFWKNTPNFN